MLRLVGKAVDADDGKKKDRYPRQEASFSYIGRRKKVLKSYSFPAPTRIERTDGSIPQCQPRQPTTVTYLAVDLHSLPWSQKDDMKEVDWYVDPCKGVSLVPLRSPCAPALLCAVWPGIGGSQWCIFTPVRHVASY